MRPILKSTPHRTRCREDGKKERKGKGNVRKTPPGYFDDPKFKKRKMRSLFVHPEGEELEGEEEEERSREDGKKERNGRKPEKLKFYLSSPHSLTARES